ncbi:cell division protein FtsQ/DivIB [Algicella marina]|uniref:Cell division protein FtsQ n=1 Tax=Algicella marina TaxID=2683284 RepID=A0A6P1STP3_9RHOB|nr:cell division protein FtsQ/DivIB [Algicella marina]QHQ34054.1 cell division protein FtsQ [Algicella marina]
MLPVRRPDPAPSRVKYRLERLWLTPSFRRFVRTGLPLALVLVAVTALVTDLRVRAMAAETAEDIRTYVAERPEFRIARVQITGASPELSARVGAEMAMELPVSAFDLDLQALRDRVMALEPVLTARVRVAEAHTLEVTVVERTPVAIWRMQDGLALVDGSGARVDTIDRRGDRPDLPVMAGKGAEKAIEEGLSVMRIAAPLEARIRGLVRVGERRWDLVLDREQVIQLPETRPEAALLRILALDSAKDLLERDLVIVDLRDGDRPVVRLSQPGLAEFNARKMLGEDDSDEDDA